MTIQIFIRIFTKKVSDTIRYSQTKEQVLGTSNFFTFELWQSDAEFMSQTFLLSGASISISGVEVFARKKSTVASLTLNALIYNVDINNNPTTSIGSAAIVITDTVYQYRQITFTSPITVNNKYAIVIQPTVGIVQFYVNNAAPNQSYDENLSRFKSSK